MSVKLNEINKQQQIYRSKFLVYISTNFNSVLSSSSILIMVLSLLGDRQKDVDIDMAEADNEVEDSGDGGTPLLVRNR